MTTINFGTHTRDYPGRHGATPNGSPPALPHTLAEAVEYAVNQVDVDCLNPIAHGSVSPVRQARTLLGLLTFCYARQVYSSSDIAKQLSRELLPLRVKDIQAPDPQMLQRFRAENREPLQFCLRSALLFLAREKIRQGVVTHVKPEHIYREANRRVIMAMFTDSIEEPHRNGGLETGLGFEVAIREGTVH